MTEPGGALRELLRDLIPDYTGPVDPLPRVLASVRRRRGRQRTLLAVGAAGAAAVVALTGPAVLLPSSQGQQAGYPVEPVDPAPIPTGPAGTPAPKPVVHDVARGTVGTAEWAIGSTSLSTAGARRCLYSDDEIFTREVACFDDWSAGAPATWAVRQVTWNGLTVTRITGVAPAGSVRVVVRLADGRALPATALQTATDPAARFFGLVVRGAATVGSVTAFDATGAALGPPVTDPGTSCRPMLQALCAAEN